MFSQVLNQIELLLESLEYSLLHTSVVTRPSLGLRLPKVSLTIVKLLGLLIEIAIADLGS